MELKDYLAQFGSVEATPTSGFQRVVARRLSESWTSVPHVTHNDDVDVTTLESYRKALASDVAISPLIFIVKALVSAMKAFPAFNCSLSEDQKSLIQKHYYHVGIAVDGPLGLLVPVIRDADQKSVREIAVELRELSSRAREKGLPMSAMQGGCMTISSLGGIGGTSFTPIINPPEVAVLGVTRTRTVPSWDGKEFCPPADDAAVTQLRSQGHQRRQRGPVCPPYWRRPGRSGRVIVGRRSVFRRDGHPQFIAFIRKRNLAREAR